jgi:hypothetical protein
VTPVTFQNVHGRQRPIELASSACGGMIGGMVSRRTVRVLEIAELLGVSHQRASKIADEPGFPAPVGWESQSRLWDRREVTASAEGLAPREALALSHSPGAPGVHIPWYPRHHYANSRS